jgi:antitoxin component HigA of HigAB toxin-antitoxin module
LLWSMKLASSSCEASHSEWGASLNAWHKVTKKADWRSFFGSESIVSEVLNRKRVLNKTHIEKLSKRFGVSPAVFF